MIQVEEALIRAQHEEWARMIASLTMRFGLDVAEEAAAEAFATAVERWPADGVPPNPGAWLTTTATRRAIDRLRRENKRDGKQKQAQMVHDDEPLDPTGIIDDDRLRLIFTCCHPALALETRVALTLRMLGGLTVAEIARTFLVQETAMGQRITRAKAKIKAARVPYRVPAAKDLPARVSGVLAVLFLVFNEGYLATGADTGPLRHDLTLEAIRLTRLLRILLPDDGEVTGLLALMLLIEARHTARMSATGQLVTLDEQDRGAWDRALIVEGHALVRERLVAAAAGVEPGRYQILAAINAVHTAARDVRDTDWSQVLVLYDQLVRLDPSPIVALGRRAGWTAGRPRRRRPSPGPVGRLSPLPCDPRRPAETTRPEPAIARGVRQGDPTGGQHRRDCLPDPSPRPTGRHRVGIVHGRFGPGPDPSIASSRRSRRRALRTRSSEIDAAE